MYKYLYNLHKFILLISLFVLVTGCSYGQKNRYLVGAYYFDGWTGAYPNHITEALKTTYKAREPKWGWINSTQESVDEQIVEASNAGISFFSFCWYYHNPDRYKTEKMNQAFRLYLKSSQRNKLKYCLMVTNHPDSELGPKEWPAVMDLWIEQFKNPQYLTVGGKPLLIFFEVASLVKRFGSTDQVKKALDQVRQHAINNGLPGVNITICTPLNSVEIPVVNECGFDLMTGYNYHPIAFKDGQKSIPINKLQEAEQKYWNNFKGRTNIPYFPVVTLGWDPRPWGMSYSPYYTGFSETSVQQSVKGAIDWVNRNSRRTPKEKIIMLYAWNEYGEGAWLAPGKDGSRPLDGIKKALKKK